MPHRRHTCAFILPLVTETLSISKPDIIWHLGNGAGTVWEGRRTE